MSRRVKISASLLVGIRLASMTLFGQSNPNFGAAPPGHNGFGNSGGFVQPYFYPNSNWNGYGYSGYFSPFLYFPSDSPLSPAFAPKYWWVSWHPLADPRQAGYNPSSGYAKETVTTLLLTTSPEKSRVILDGLYVGTADALGPFQLPVGEHTLRVEAAGYEPSETVLKAEEPALQQLEIRLTPASRGKPAPRS